MKWNTTTAAVAFLMVGLAGFFVGKMTSGESGGGADELIDRARQVSSEKSSPSWNGSTPRRDSAGRSTRSGSNRFAKTFDERLRDMESIVRGRNALARGRAMFAWIDSLAPNEFEDAVALYQSLEWTDKGDGARMSEYAMLLSAWAEVDPTAALAYTIKNTPAEDTRSSMVATVLAAWASRDPESAKQWISSQSDERLKDDSTRHLARELAMTDPAGTASWLLANLSGQDSTHSVMEVFEQWAKTDKSAAMDFFGKLPPGEARTRALRGLVTIETRENPQAAVQLMDTNATDVDDRMVMDFIRPTFNDAPALALSQVGKIPDEGSRNGFYKRYLDFWLKRDQAAAESWINSTNLPESVLESLENSNNP